MNAGVSQAVSQCRAIARVLADRGPLPAEDIVRLTCLAEAVVKRRLLKSGPQMYRVDLRYFCRRDDGTWGLTENGHRLARS